jgi:uncharacterized protein
MIRFEGREAFSLPQVQLFEKLANAEFLVRSLPDSEILLATADVSVWKLRPKLGFLSGALETTLTVTGREPASRSTYSVVGKGVGASSTVTAVLCYEPSETGTVVAWTAEVTALTGLLKLVPKGLIQSAAEKVIADIWTAVKAAV